MIVTHNHDGAIVAVEINGTRYSPEALALLASNAARATDLESRLTTAETTIRDARFVLAAAFQQGQPPVSCPQLRDIARRTLAVLRRVP